MIRSKRRVARPRLWVEELEPRVVLSTLLTTSTNWSGFAVQTSLTAPANNAVSAVTGSWTVPAVTGSPGATAYSSVWVGIDGYSSSTVEQIGTESDWTNGAPVYYAWYEMYPKNSVNVTKLAVHPDDSITASVTYSGGKFTLQITDVTTSQSFTTTQSAPTANRSSAEWIVEAPSNGLGVLPLANFGSTSFTNASATLTVAKKATTGAIDNPAWQNASINLVTSSNSTEAITSGLTDSANKSSFSVSYNAPVTTTTPPPPPRTGHQHWWWWSTLDPSSMQFVPQLGLAGNSGNMNFVPQLGLAGNFTPPFSFLNPIVPTTLSQGGTVLGGHPARHGTVPAMPAHLPFRAFGAGDVGAPPGDGAESIPPVQRPMAAPMPNRQAPPALVIPPAPASDPAPNPGPANDDRQSRSGGLGNALLALVGLAGFVALRREREPDESPRKRPPERLA